MLAVTAKMVLIAFSDHCRFLSGGGVPPPEASTTFLSFS